MDRPSFTIGIGHRYDSLYLRNGTVKVEGFDVEYPKPPEREATQPRVQIAERYIAPSTMFTSIATKAVYDVGELPLSTYIQSVDKGKEVTAIPVFPSRIFPHNQVAVHSKSGIRRPADLAGKRVGVGFFSKNYAVWLRGVLRHQYDVPVEKIVWVEDEPEHFPDYRAAKRYAIERAPQRSKSPEVKALFENPYPEIKEYFACRVFPINTIITVPKKTLAKNSAIPQAVFEAFRKAFRLYLEEMKQGKREDEHGGLSLKRLEKEAGITLPEYGFKANRAAIRMMIHLCFEQGIISRLYEPEELFLLTNT